MKWGLVILIVIALLAMAVGGLVVTSGETGVSDPAGEEEPEEAGRITPARGEAPWVCGL